MWTRYPWRICVYARYAVGLWEQVVPKKPTHIRFPMVLEETAGEKLFGDGVGPGGGDGGDGQGDGEGEEGDEEDDEEDS